MNNLYNLRKYLVTIEKTTGSEKGTQNIYTGESLYMTDDPYYSVYELSSDGQAVFKGKAISIHIIDDEEEIILTPKDLTEYDDPCGYGKITWKDNKYIWEEHTVIVASQLEVKDIIDDLKGAKLLIETAIEKISKHLGD